MRVAPTLLRSVPVIALAMLFFGMQPPPSLASGLGWLLTTGGAVALNCAFMTLVTVSLFWTLSGECIQRAALPAVYLFSGMLMPLAFWPSWMQPLLHFLPFRGMVALPFRVYLGQVTPVQSIPEFGIQLLWTGSFIVAGRALVARGVHRLVAQGG